MNTPYCYMIRQVGPSGSLAKDSDKHVHFPDELDWVYQYYGKERQIEELEPYDYMAPGQWFMIPLYRGVNW